MGIRFLIIMRQVVNEISSAVDDSMIKHPRFQNAKFYKVMKLRLIVYGQYKAAHFLGWWIGYSANRDFMVSYQGPQVWCAMLPTFFYHFKFWQRSQKKMVKTLTKKIWSPKFLREKPGLKCGALWYFPDTPSLKPGHHCLRGAK